LADFVQLPGDLSFRIVNGDEVNAAVNLNRDITGYQFTTYIYSSPTTGAGGGTGSFTAIGPTVTQPVLSIVSQTAGTIILALSEQQTALLSPGTPYRWFLRAVAPGEVTRTILSGTVTAVAP